MTTATETASAAERDQFLRLVNDLLAQVKQWVEPHEWVTKIYPKKLRDTAGEVYTAPALVMQKGPVRVILDPISYNVPGAEAVVDLYMMPTYDDAASFVFRNDAWAIYYDFPTEPGEQRDDPETPALPFDEATLNRVLDSVVTHASAY